MYPLDTCDLFNGLTRNQFQDLSKITKKIQRRKGQILMQEGQNSEKLFVLEQGAVELLTKINLNDSYDDFELPIVILRDPGDFTGISALLEPYECSLTARCFSDSQLVCFDREDLRQLIIADHEMGCTLMKNLAVYILNRLKETRRELKIHFKTLLVSSRQ